MTKKQNKKAKREMHLEDLLKVSHLRRIMTDLDRIADSLEWFQGDAKDMITDFLADAGPLMMRIDDVETALKNRINALETREALRGVDATPPKNAA